MESLGIERSYEAMADADLTLVVVDLSAPLDAADPELIDRAAAQGRSLVAGNKCDLPPPRRPRSRCSVSALTGEGIEELRARDRRAAPAAERAGNRLHHQPPARAAAARIARVPRKGARGRRGRHPARDAAARPLRRPAPHRRHHRRHHRRRHPEPHLLHFLHRQMSTPLIEFRNVTVSRDGGRRLTPSTLHRRRRERGRAGAQRLRQIVPHQDHHARVLPAPGLQGAHPRPGDVGPVRAARAARHRLERPHAGLHLPVAGARDRALRLLRQRGRVALPHGDPGDGTAHGRSPGAAGNRAPGGAPRGRDVLRRGAPRADRPCAGARPARADARRADHQPGLPRQARAAAPCCANSPRRAPASCW